MYACPIVRPGTSLSSAGVSVGLFEFRCGIEGSRVCDGQNKTLAVLEVSEEMVDVERESLPKGASPRWEEQEGPGFEPESPIMFMVLDWPEAYAMPKLTVVLPGGTSCLAATRSQTAPLATWRGAHGGLIRSRLELIDPESG